MGQPLVAATSAPARRESESPAVQRRLRATLDGFWPAGTPLDDRTWIFRHRAVLAILWVHAVGMAVYGAVVGDTPWHGLSEAAIVAVLALAASVGPPSRLFKSSVASLGLLTVSALMVHLSGGLIEMHFYFFVMIPVVTLYQGWVPFVLAFIFVILHHGVVGILEPRLVYNHPVSYTHLTLPTIYSV